MLFSVACQAMFGMNLDAYVKVIIQTRNEMLAEQEQNRSKEEAHEGPTVAVRDSLHGGFIAKPQKDFTSNPYLRSKHLQVPKLNSRVKLYNTIAVPMSGVPSHSKQLQHTFLKKRKRSSRHTASQIEEKSETFFHSEIDGDKKRRRSDEYCESDAIGSESEE